MIAILKLSKIARGTSWWFWSRLFEVKHPVNVIQFCTSDLSEFRSKGEKAKRLSFCY